ncbi:hypothetical protein PDM28_04665 [Stenotrophomonas aracearum]|mgnify:CR=1 FL=1|jgi:hypothetical protein|uniref:Uncharacterized protein n=1 Tax=Stenotrophomonas aracearum TaxID=3003272 RepID=A0ABY9YFG0_9GAMM|nr:hypothetical protein [Stenotrophomonas sp. A5588]WNH49614.1 hypothetical protein PDM28_04665 [Stenotrophomonas sp. A5588]
MDLQTRLDLLADLSMAAQGFRPSPGRLLRLTSLGLMWLHPSKPPVTGMTEAGKASFLSLLCEGSGIDPVSLLAPAHRFHPSVEQFNAGTSFLDTLEAEARSGTKVTPTVDNALFALWLCRRLPPQPPPLADSAVDEPSDVQDTDPATGCGT